jgi:hypothetical protein
MGALISPAPLPLGAPPEVPNACHRDLQRILREQKLITRQKRLTNRQNRLTYIDDFINYVYPVQV